MLVLRIDIVQQIVPKYNRYIMCIKFTRVIDLEEKRFLIYDYSTA